MGVFTQSSQNVQNINITQYVGPGDAVPAAPGWWGLRAYSRAKIGSAAIRLRRSSDNAEQDFVTLFNGSLDVASIVTFKGAANLFVSKLYDQGSGAHDMAQTTAVSQPAFTLNALGALPALTFTSSSTQFLITTPSPRYARNVPYTLTGVFKRNNVRGAIFAFYNAGPRIDGTAANTLTVYNGVGTFTVSATDGNWHAVQFGFSQDANSFGSVDGTTATGNAGDGTADSTGSDLIIGANENGFDPYDGLLTEIGMYDFKFSGAQVSATNSNQHSYWGF